MQHQVLDIRAGAAGTTAKLYTYIRDESPEMEAHRRPAVVICPGGGYGMTSDREAEPVALKFLEKGFQCFVLRYSVEPVRFPAALLQLATAVAMVRSRADRSSLMCAAACATLLPPVTSFWCISSSAASTAHACSVMCTKSAAGNCSTTP